MASAPTASPPFVECEMHHPTLSVADLRAAVDVYTGTLGFQPGFTWGDPPTMAGVELGGVSIHLAQGTPTDPHHPLRPFLEGGALSCWKGYEGAG